MFTRGWRLLLGFAAFGVAVVGVVLLMSHKCDEQYWAWGHREPEGGGTMFPCDSLLYQWTPDRIAGWSLVFLGGAALVVVLIAAAIGRKPRHRIEPETPSAPASAVVGDRKRR